MPTPPTDLEDPYRLRQPLKFTEAPRDLELRQADAPALPFEDESFDSVLSQMALMFFGDRAAALREMSRVTAAGGTVAVLVPGAIEHQEFFSRFVDMASRHAGAEAHSLLTTYFVCGGLDELAAHRWCSGSPKPSTAGSGPRRTKSWRRSPAPRAGWKPPSGATSS